MADVNVTALRQNLPEYLARVAQGEVVRVTVRGTVVAEICPPSCAADDAARARERLRGSVLRFDAPTEPVLGADQWDMNR